VPHPIRVDLGSSENDVIDQLDVDGPRGLAKLAGDLQVGGTW